MKKLMLLVLVGAVLMSGCSIMFTDECFCTREEPPHAQIFTDPCVTPTPTETAEPCICTTSTPTPTGSPTVPVVTTTPVFTPTSTQPHKDPSPTPTEKLETPTATATVAPPTVTPTSTNSCPNPICHKTGKAGWKTYCDCFTDKCTAAHLAHGDYLGVCK
jgi:hypothetical protein